MSLRFNGVAVSCATVVSMRLHEYLSARSLRITLNAGVLYDDTLLGLYVLYAYPGTAQIEINTPLLFPDGRPRYCKMRLTRDEGGNIDIVPIGIADGAIGYWALTEHARHAPAESLIPATSSRFRTATAQLMRERPLVMRERPLVTVLDQPHAVLIRGIEGGGWRDIDLLLYQRNPADTPPLIGWHDADGFGYGPCLRYHDNRGRRRVTAQPSSDEPAAPLHVANAQRLQHLGLSLCWDAGCWTLTRGDAVILSGASQSEAAAAEAACLDLEEMGHVLNN